jgi:hypothetical protein
MAAGHVKIADVIVPTPFTQYVAKNTKTLSAFVNSGIMVESDEVRQFLAGGGLTETKPSWKDLDDDTPRVGTDVESPLYTAGFGTAFPAPSKIGTFSETLVRCNRNNHWSATKLAKYLAGADAFRRIGDRVSSYWARHWQLTLLAMLTGLFADNDAAPGGQDTHSAGDLTFDISGLNGGTFLNGLTNFSAEALMDTAQTAGDAKSMFTTLAIHSVVHTRMKKNNLIDFKQDSVTGDKLEYFQDYRLVVDDGMTKVGQVYQSILFMPGVIEFANLPPDQSTEVVWRPEAGNGTGAEELWSRVQFCMHPMGHAYIGTAPSGGPDNTASANMLAAAGSWSRRTPERKQVGLARLITREA